VRAWEQSSAKWLRAIGLESIRRKILVFGVLATLVPSIGIAYVSYAQNKRAVTEKIAQGLEALSKPGASNVDIWYRSHLLDLRVFASSDVLTQNVGRGALGGGVARLTDYLRSVREHIPDYDVLAALDLKGRVVALSGRQARLITLPSDWQAQLRASDAAMGEPYRDSVSKHAVMVMAVPIKSGVGRAAGTLAVLVDLRGLASNLQRFVPRDSGRYYVVTGTGVLVAGTPAAPDAPLRDRLPPVALRGFTGHPGEAVEYTSFGGRSVVGVLEPTEHLGWASITEVPSTAAFRQIAHLRNVTVWVVALMFVSVGLLAYVLGLLIVHPLDRLTEGAATVAGGDLGVDLPDVGGGEVGDLTKVFNNMVSRLREGREALERLSVTDALTGLFNRRRLMETLAAETERSQRGKHSFALVMLDVDHFKAYNDTHGHQAGDKVLLRVAEILKETTRQIDCTARYGGEEFTVLLPETELGAAAEVAERLRMRVAAERFGVNSVTISLGVAAFPMHGASAEAMVASGDVALYRAKSEGRNRVVLAGGGKATTARQPRVG
jgi:diguanylate cyclase (GGDEF)-like protein